MSEFKSRIDSTKVSSHTIDGTELESANEKIKELEALNKSIIAAAEFNEENCNMHREKLKIAVEALENVETLMTGAPSISPMNDEIILKQTREALAQIKDA